MHGSVQWYLAGVIELAIVGGVAMGGRAQTLDPRLAVSDQEEDIIRFMDTTESGRYAGVLIGGDIDHVHVLDSGVTLVPLAVG